MNVIFDLIGAPLGFVFMLCPYTSLETHPYIYILTDPQHNICIRTCAYTHHVVSTKNYPNPAHMVLTWCPHGKQARPNPSQTTQHRNCRACASPNVKRSSLPSTAHLSPSLGLEKKRLEAVAWPTANRHLSLHTGCCSLSLSAPTSPHRNRQAGTDTLAVVVGKP